MIDRAPLSIRRELARYAWRDRKPTLFVASLLLIALGYGIFQGMGSLQPLLRVWDQVVGILVDIATLLIAVMLWYSEFKNSWLRSLPVRLDVDFTFNGAHVMRCAYAHLGSELDARQLGQQIGRQMVAAKTGSEANLKFRAPKVELRAVGAQWNPHEVNYCNLYRVHFELQELPTGLDADQCLVWSPPFDDVVETDRHVTGSDEQGGALPKSA